MKRSIAWWLAGVAIISVLVWSGWNWWIDQNSATDQPEAVNIKVQLEGARDQANLVQNTDGSYSYILQGLDGERQILSPHEFAERVHRQQQSRTLLGVLFNISSPTGVLWVSLGLLGQLMFTGRMVVQWLISEKNKRSVVPPIFWWFSILGGLMLLAYFLWRRDVVGVLGQAFGLAIYARNIHLTWRGGAESTMVDAA